MGLLREAKSKEPPMPMPRAEGVDSLVLLNLATRAVGVDSLVLVLVLVLA